MKYPLYALESVEQFVLYAILASVTFIVNRLFIRTVHLFKDNACHTVFATIGSSRRKIMLTAISSPV